MKTKFILAAAILLSGAAASAQNESNFKFYGFIRNYAHVDTKESLSGTVDLFNYVPKPTAANYEGNGLKYVLKDFGDALRTGNRRPVTLTAEESLRLTEIAEVLSRTLDA